jgi:hypothetical protein
MAYDVHGNHQPAPRLFADQDPPYTGQWLSYHLHLHAGGQPGVGIAVILDLGHKRSGLQRSGLPISSRPVTYIRPVTSVPRRPTTAPGVCGGLRGYAPGVPRKMSFFVRKPSFVNSVS